MTGVTASRVINTSNCGWLAAMLLASTAFTNAAQAQTTTYTKTTTTVGGKRITIFTKRRNFGGALRITTAYNRLWFAETNARGSRIVRFQTSGKARSFKIPGAPTKVNAIGTDHNGRVWFVGFNNGVIGRVAKNGQMKLFDSGLSQNRSNDIIRGPKNMMWFPTDFDGLGRMTLKGQVTFFPIANNADQPTALTLDSKNRIWYVEWTGNHVGRMKQNGLFDEYNAKFNGFSNSFGIAKGPRGRIWFCDPQHKRIGRMTNNGTQLKFFKKGANFQPATIIEGPDGSLYFGTYNNEIGRITRNGKITIYPIPGASSSNPFPVLGMTVGPDGNIWFVNNQRSQVGRLEL